VSRLADLFGQLLRQRRRSPPCRHAVFEEQMEEYLLMIALGLGHILLAKTRRTENDGGRNFRLVKKLLQDAIRKRGGLGARDWQIKDVFDGNYDRQFRVLVKIKRVGLLSLRRVGTFAQHPAVNASSQRGLALKWDIQRSLNESNQSVGVEWLLVKPEMGNQYIENRALHQHGVVRKRIHNRIQNQGGSIGHVDVDILRGLVLWKPLQEVMAGTNADRRIER
jgi:hypothetical protein